MKARIENGSVVIYDVLPNTYKSDSLGLVLDFKSLSTAIHEAEGFFRVVEPAFDYYTQYLGAIYFDTVNKIFTYPILQLAVPVPAFEKKISQYDFIRLFTRAERKAVRVKVLTDANLLDDWDMVSRMSAVSKTNNKVIDLLNTLEANGCIAAGRANEMLTT